MKNDLIVYRIQIEEGMQYQKGQLIKIDGLDYEIRSIIKVEWDLFRNCFFMIGKCREVQLVDLPF
ncbi:hypothetical protein [Bacillus mycoides]|uniref:hypothetical protein n=1 Tax=Bacillus mycoides TaxID=1405 RepID=UPI0011EC0B4C|nr:hypothetical protein [Bacillus mycoides]QEL88510.1 hypothetical protein DN409_30055 [Bacillus mycoides]